MSNTYLLKNYTNNNLSIAKRINDQHRTIHYHDCIEISILMEGNGIHFLNGEELPYKKYDVSILSFNDFHSIYNLTSKNIIYNIMVHPRLIRKELLNKLEHSPYPKQLSPSTEDAKIFINLFNAVDRMKTSKTDFNDMLFENIVNTIISVYFSLCTTSNTSKKGTVSIENTFQKALSYINQNYQQNISLTDVANRVYMSSCYLSDCFRKKLNITFKEYLNKTRITHAKQLLATTEHPITFICYECGFSAMATFLRVFNEFEGTTPSHYRKNSQLNEQ